MRRAELGKACIAALCVAGAWGCAANEAAAPAAPDGMKEESREPATIEEAQAQLERARAQLPGTSVAPTTPSAGATVETATGAGASTQTESPPPPSATRLANEQLHRCGNACGAMSSMKRAVDAICRMAGETDARCTDARKTLKDSETKVAGCGCPAP